MEKNKSYILHENYSTKEYRITVIYTNGAHRIESNSKISIQKIPVKVLSPKITVKNKTVHVKARFVDDKNKLVKYPTYLSAKIDGKTILNANGTAMRFYITEGIIDFSFELTTTYKKGNHTFMFVIPELRPNLGIRQNTTMTIV